MKLIPTAECQAPHYACGWVESFDNWKAAYRAGESHHKATHHVVRIEHIRTVLIGWEPDQSQKEGA